MKSYMLSNGNLVIPIRAEGDAIIGDAPIVISKLHPSYAAWLSSSIPATPEIEQAFGKATGMDK